MRFITSIFMLLAATSGVISAYFIGHGLVSEHSWPWLVALGLLVASVAFGFVFMRLARNDPQPVSHAHAHVHADGEAHTHPHTHTDTDPNEPGHTHD